MKNLRLFTHEPLKKFIYSIFFFIVLEALVATLIYVNINNQKETFLETRTELAQNEYKIAYWKLKEESLLIFQEKINTQTVINLLKNVYDASALEQNSSRNELYDHLLPGYQRLKKLLGLRQLHFVLPDNHSFLRMHRPNKYGDDLSKIRLTHAYVNKHKKSIDSFEEGRVNYGYRFVYPLFDNDDNYLCSVEVSFSADAIQSALTNNSDTRTLFLVKKELSKDKVWDIEKSNYITAPISEQFFVDKDTLPLNGSIIKYISDKNKQTFQKYLKESQAYSTHIDAETENYIFSFLPVTNTLNNYTGAYMVVVSKSHYFNMIKLQHVITQSIALLLVLLLFYMHDRRQKYLEVLRMSRMKYKEVAKKLKTSNENLERINKRKSEFLSSMSHELRTPLNGIIGSADLLSEQLFGKLNDKQLSYAKQIVKSADHLLSLINDILNMAKIDAGKMELNLTQFTLTGWIDGVTGIMQTELEEKGINVFTQIDSSNEHIIADYRKCNQIMLNLLSNALKYSPRGKTITVRISDENHNGIRVEVQDQGIGISKEDSKLIFSEFYQVNRERDESLGGMGIGLALTRRLVELHRGTIGVKDTEEGGALFWFTLPIHHLEEYTDTEGRADDDAVTSKCQKDNKLLLVDDNDLNISIMLDMLSSCDFNISVARNGKMAVDMAQAFKPDIILMDIQMPVMDGFEACRLIKKLPGFDKIPMIAVTASVTEVSKVEQTEAGYADHLSKPFKRNELIEILSKYL